METIPGWALHVFNMLFSGGIVTVVGYLVRMKIDDVDKRIERLEGMYFERSQREIWNDDVRRAYRHQLEAQGGKRIYAQPR